MPAAAQKREPVPPRGARCALHTSWSPQAAAGFHAVKTGVPSAYPWNHQPPVRGVMQPWDNQRSLRVMPGLVVPPIHVSDAILNLKTWMTATSAGMTPRLVLPAQLLRQYKPR